VERLAEFRVLGPLEVIGGDGTPVRLPGGRARVVLALLCATPGRVVTRDRLIDVAWGGAPPPTAVTQLHGYISGLRQLLAGPGQQARPGQEVIVTDGEGYALRAGPDEVDLLRMRTLVREARDQPGLLKEAVGLWRGHPFTGLDVPALDAAADLIEEEYLAALEAYAEAGPRGDGQALIVPLARACDRHPLREGLHAALITALARSGRQADAIAAYHRLRAGLTEELGIDPGPELRGLYLRLLDQDGYYPASTPVVRPAQLPPDIGDFTGRAGYVRRLGAALAATADRPAVLTISTVSGAGGIGKTALAVHAAHLAAPQFPDGQLYVDLGGASDHPADPADVLARLLRDLGSPAEDAPVTVAELTGRYRSVLADRKVLLLLDDAKDAAQVRPLLPGTADCLVLVTSRATLADLTGTYRFDLAELDRDEAGELFTRIVGADRVAAEPEAARRVLRSCAGLPLAIRIAGARLAARPRWTIEAMASRLAAGRDRLNELRVGDLAVRASFQLSYSTLGTAQAHAFRLLGLTPAGTFGLSAAAALTGLTMAETESVLDELTDAHLLEAPEPGRHRLHDLLRLFAAELAAAGLSQAERDAATHRLVSWYAAALRSAGQALRPDPLPPGGDLELPRTTGDIPGFAAHKDALTWCELEEPSLLWAIGAAAASRWHDHVVCMACLIWRYYFIAGSPHALERIQRLAAASARELGDDAAYATVQSHLGWACTGTGSYQAALDCFREALTVRERLGDRLGAAAVLGSFASAFDGLGRHAEALERETRACRMAEELGAGLLQGRQLHNQSHTLFKLGDYETAAARGAEAVRLLRQHGDRVCEGLARTGLGMALHALGRQDEALVQHRLAVAIQSELGASHRQRTESLIQLTAMLADLGRPEEARQTWAQAMHLTERDAEPRASDYRAQLEAVREKLASQDSR
jgi:DNA-binding SARP family transcriptional activator